MGNLLLQTDSYKHSHFLQYPPGTQRVSSYIESRSEDKDSPLMFFGLQAFIERYLRNPVTAYHILEAKGVLSAHGLPFNEEGWNHILKKHDGFLPLSIQALPEGTMVGHRVPLVQITNTDPTVPWLTSFIETAILRSIWYPTNVATLSFAAKVFISYYMNLTSDAPELGTPFKLHDFGARGVSSGESAALGGMAHLVNFKGSDTLEAIALIREIYGDGIDYMPGFSIPASEHSTMTAWGPTKEAEAYSNMIDKFQNSLFSIVSDSYDLFNAVDNIFGEELKSKIEAIPGKLVVRPDSGDPVQVTIDVLEALWDKFGGSINSKGYRVLHPKVAVIQGDGLDLMKIMAILHYMEDRKLSIDNIAFGMGGGLLQGHKRDDWGFAMKTNAIDLGDGWQDVQKKPVTDAGKASKAGRQAVIRDEESGELIAVREDALTHPDRNELVEVWNKDQIGRPLFEDVRKRADEATAKMVSEIQVRAQKAAA